MSQRPIVGRTNQNIGVLLVECTTHNVDWTLQPELGQDFTQRRGCAVSYVRVITKMAVWAFFGRGHLEKKLMAITSMSTHDSH